MIAGCCHCTKCVLLVILRAIFEKASGEQRDLRGEEKRRRRRRERKAYISPPVLLEQHCAIWVCSTEIDWLCVCVDVQTGIEQQGRDTLDLFMNESRDLEWHDGSMLHTSIPAMEGKRHLRARKFIKDRKINPWRHESKWVNLSHPSFNRFDQSRLSMWMSEETKTSRRRESRSNDLLRELDMITIYIRFCIFEERLLNHLSDRFPTARCVSSPNTILGWGMWR